MDYRNPKLINFKNPYVWIVIFFLVIFSVIPSIYESGLFISILFLAAIGFLIIISYTFVLTSKRTTYYITSLRVIDFLSKSLLSKKKKFKEIQLNNIDFIRFWRDDLEIGECYPDREHFYKGDEIEYKNIIKRKYKYLLLRLSGKEGEKIKEKIVEILSKTVPMVQHSNLEWVYLKKKV